MAYRKVKPLKLHFTKAKWEFIVAKTEKFVAVDGKLRPGQDGEELARAAKRARGARSRMARQGGGKRPMPGSHKRILAWTWLGLAFMALYAGTVGAALFQPGYTVWDRIASAFLLFGLGFIVLHGLGYANSMVKSIWGYKQEKPRLFVSSNSPRVACIVASFNEPAEVLEETVAALVSLDYANKQVVLLDDSTRPENREAARKIAERYGIQCVQRTNRRGYKAGAINDFLPELDAEYVAIFDADALPVSKFLLELVPLIDENPRLAFVQTPQFYANTNVSYVALASARQQNVFYEYICEGKSYSDAAFCCGTNVLFRLKALQDVNGFDEDNVTEDFATSFKLHFQGWDSLYLNRVFVYSLAPENLAAYFMQQSRWSFGSMGVLKFLLAPFFKSAKKMRAGQWWEYFLSTTYYYVGIVTLIFMLLPLAYIFFGVKPLRQDVWTYLAVFVPYFAFTLNMFYSGMEARDYKLGEVVLGQQIGFISFPVHVASAMSALLGRKRPFGVTPKGVGGRLPWKALWPQLLMLALSTVGFCWGIYRYAAGFDRNTTAILINSAWALYHVWMLGSIFKLNKPVREGSSTKAFFDNPRGARAKPTLSELEGARNPITLGRVATGVALATFAALGFVGWNVVSWNRAPGYPVNIYLVDRTVGANNQKHSSLFWTLNFLKARKTPAFGPSLGRRTNYDSNLDFYGPVRNPRARPVKDALTGVPTIVSADRPLPSRLAAPGALYLVDTYGETEEVDARSGNVVRQRSRRRGIGADEIDRLETFARRGGLMIGEWNTLSYPTRPGGFLAPAQLERIIERARLKLRNLERVTLPAAQRAVDEAQRGASYKQLGIIRGRLEDVRGQIVDAEYKLRGLQAQTFSNAVQARQARAAERLENLLHVEYGGWYGRYVENFAEEKQYDPRLWRNVRDFLTRKNGKSTEPSGPGFVFYPDGPSQIFNEAKGTLEPSPFSKPVAILGDELGIGLSGERAIVQKSGDPRFVDEPLLRGMANQVPARFWFDVVKPQAGARVLAYTKLQITVAGAKRLRGAGFPSQNIAKDGRTLVFPMLVAWRDGNASSGELRSLYFAGDAASYPQVSDVARRFPALAGVDRALSPRFGSFPSQFFWGFYEPVLRNTFETTPRLRHSGSK